MDAYASAQGVRAFVFYCCVCFAAEPLQRSRACRAREWSCGRQGGCASHLRGLGFHPACDACRCRGVPSYDKRSECESLIFDDAKRKRQIGTPFDIVGALNTD